MPGKSKTTTPVPVRLPNDLVAKIAAEVERSLLTRKGKPLTVSGFLVMAAREKLAHMARSRRSRGKSAETLSR